MARRLGLGDLSALGLVSEKQGIIPNRDWKLAQRGVVWTPGETVVAGIGQGFVLTTPLQLALMTARIANGKSAITPSLVAQNDPQLSLPLRLWMCRLILFASCIKVCAKSWQGVWEPHANMILPKE